LVLEEGELLKVRLPRLAMAGFEPLQHPYLEVHVRHDPIEPVSLLIISEVEVNQSCEQGL
jgi:hypothetical protein